MIIIRPAVSSDIQLLSSFDLIAQRDPDRQKFIVASVSAGTCYVATADSVVIGYGVLSYDFHSCGWIRMLYVAQNHRRHGAGKALIEYMEAHCHTVKLFTSTNLSNLPTQTLLVNLGYKLSGVIENLDDGDPEIVYFKRLR